MAIPATAQQDLLMRLHEARDTRRQQMLAEQGPELPRIRGLLLIYCIALTIFFVHNTFLTAGSIMVYGHSTAAGAHHIPLGSLVYYVMSNVALLAYVIYISILMRRRRRSAIVHSVIFNLLSAIFLVTWYAIGEKSTTGTIVDSIPSLVFVAYFLLSERVRKTFVFYRDGRSVA